MMKECRITACHSRHGVADLRSSLSEVVIGSRGDLIFKPRNQWHTFWNAGDNPVQIAEIIAPPLVHRPTELPIPPALTGGQAVPFGTAESVRHA